MMQLLLLGFSLFIIAAGQPPPFNPLCIVGGKSPYDRSNAGKVPWYVVDLDQPPKDRWAYIASAYKDEIQEAMKVFDDFVKPISPKIFPFLVNRLGNAAKHIPQPYQDEIRGMAEATGVDVGNFVLMTVFYELMKACTSIVAEDMNHQLLHVRNQDFGMPVGWDIVKHSYKMSEQLRKLLINVMFIRNGKILYKANTFAGLVGALTAVRQPLYSMSFDAREKLDFLSFIEWIFGMRPSAKFVTLFARDIMEIPNSFDEVIEMINKQEMIGSEYFIIGGNSTGQGCVITKSSYKTDDMFCMNTTDPHEGWYVLQTNYDWDKKPLYLDDRRTTGKKCMHKLGRLNLNFQGLYDVLSSKPNLNKNTVYTTLMQVNTGKFETYIRFCEDPCWFA